MWMAWNNFSQEELPRLSQTGTIGYGNRPSRQHISKYACGMLNTGKGGVISMGILDLMYVITPHKCVC